MANIAQGTAFWGEHCKAPPDSGCNDEDGRGKGDSKILINSCERCGGGDNAMRNAEKERTSPPSTPFDPKGRRLHRPRCIGHA